MTPILVEELVALGFREDDASLGYRRYDGGTFPLVVVEVDRVAEQERDDLLGFLGHGTLQSDEARSWLYRVTGFQMGKMLSPRNRRPSCAGCSMSRADLLSS